MVARVEFENGDPVIALFDALVGLAADDVNVATHPSERSGWLGCGLVERVAVAFHLPVTYAVVESSPPETSEIRPIRG